MRRGGRDDAGQRLPDRPPVPATAPRGARGRQWVTRWQRSSASGSSSSRRSRPARAPTRASTSPSSRAPTSVSSKRCSTPTSPKRHAVGSTPRRSRRHRRARSSTTSTSPFRASQAPGPSCSRDSATQRGSAAATSSRGSPRPSASRAARPRWSATTTRWSRGCCLRPGSPTACSTRSRACSTPPASGSARRVPRPPRAAGVAPAALFARTAAPTDDELAAMASAPAAAPEPEARDEVDELFLGG